MFHHSACHLHSVCTTQEQSKNQQKDGPSIFKSHTVNLWSHVLQTICHQMSFHMPTCQLCHCGLYRAGRRRKLCRNKTTSTFMARFDLVLRSKLCRLSTRHCGKTPPDSRVLFIWSVTECTPTINQSRGRSSSNVHHCVTERKMRKLRENELYFSTAERAGVNDLSLTERFGQVDWKAGS